MTSEDIEKRFAAVDEKIAAVDAALARGRVLGLGVTQPEVRREDHGDPVGGRLGQRRVFRSVGEPGRPCLIEGAADARVLVHAPSLFPCDEPSESGPALDEPVGGE